MRVRVLRPDLWDQRAAGSLVHPQPVPLRSWQPRQPGDGAFWGAGGRGQRSVGVPDAESPACLRAVFLSRRLFPKGVTALGDASLLAMPEDSPTGCRRPRRHSAPSPPQHRLSAAGDGVPAGSGPARPGDRRTPREDFNCCHLPFGHDLLLPVFSQLEREPGLWEGFSVESERNLGGF